MPVLSGEHNLSPLVEIGLTDLPKSGDAIAPPAPPGTRGLHICIQFLEFAKIKSLSALFGQGIINPVL